MSFSEPWPVIRARIQSRTGPPLVGDWPESERPDLERRYANTPDRVLELIRDCAEAIPLTRRVAADILAQRKANTP